MKCVACGSTSLVEGEQLSVLERINAETERPEC